MSINIKHSLLKMAERAEMNTRQCRCRKKTGYKKRPQPAVSATTLYNPIGSEEELYVRAQCVLQGRVGAGLMVPVKQQ